MEQRPSTRSPSAAEALGSSPASAWTSWTSCGCIKSPAAATKSCVPAGNLNPRARRTEKPIEWKERAFEFYTPCSQTGSLSYWLSSWDTMLWWWPVKTLKTIPEQYFRVKTRNSDKMSNWVLVHQKRLAAHFYFVFVLKLYTKRANDALLEITGWTVF